MDIVLHPRVTRAISNRIETEHYEWLEGAL